MGLKNSLIFGVQIDYEYPGGNIGKLFEKCAFLLLSYFSGNKSTNCKLTLHFHYNMWKMSFQRTVPHQVLEFLIQFHKCQDYLTLSSQINTVMTKVGSHQKRKELL